MRTPSPPTLGASALALGWMKQTSNPAAPFSDATGGKSAPRALKSQSVADAFKSSTHRPNVVQRRFVNGGALGGVHRLHQVDLNTSGPFADDGNVLVHILALAPERACDGDTKKIDPESTQLGLVGGTDRDLLHPKDSKRSIH